MAVASYTNPRNNIAYLFNKLLWQPDRETFAATEDTFPVKYMPEWFRLIDITSEYDEIFIDVTGSTTAFDFVTRRRTQPIIDYEMQRLETVAQVSDEIAFSLAVDAMNWETRPAEDYERAIRLALLVGAHLKARKLTNQGVEKYPDHLELQKFSRVLASPKVIDTHLPPDPNAQADIEWIKAHREKYRGQWVALHGGQLLAVAPTISELVKVIGNPKGTGILVTRVY